MKSPEKPKRLLALILCGVVCFAASGWAGCEDDGESSTRAVFRLAEPQGQERFFELPWPNDLRRNEDGTLDLTEFPSDTVMVTDYLAIFDGSIPGYSTQGGVYFRFTGPVDPGSLPETPADSVKSTSSVFLVDVDKTSPGYGKRVPVEVSFSAERKSVGSNALVLLPFRGFVLRPKTTYAAVVTRRLEGTDGKPVARGEQISAVLSPDEPSDPLEKRAWEIYEPLRGFLTDAKIPSRDVVSAAVFTTQDPVSMMGKLRDAIYRDVPAPPAPLGMTHRASTDRLHLYEGTYETPIYQHGEAPYSRSGGDIRVDENGDPIFVRMEEIRFAVSVPTGEMPEDGWPVVLYAHGTGGSYLSFYYSGVASNLARVEDEGGVVSGFAMIGIDQVVHGTRCGEETCSPETDFFNFNNPLAGRDNVRQAAIDNFHLIRLASVLRRSSAPGTGQSFELDGERMYFMGHSQGGLTGPPFLAYARRIRAAVLSGAGGNMILSLLQKTEPVDISALVAIMLDDEEVDRFHPALTLIQTFIEPSDSINYGRLITTEPPAGCEPKSVYQSQGLIDHYTPPDLMEALGVALGLEWAVPKESELAAFELVGQPEPIERPVSHNIAGETATGVFVQYPEAEGADGHFVVFDRQDAMRDYAMFLATDAAEGIATLPAN